MKTAPFDQRAPVAFVVALLTMAGSALGFQLVVNALNVYLHKEPVALRGPFAVIPRTFDGWKADGEDGRFAKELEEELGTDQYLDRVYVTGERSRDRRALRVHLAYYTGMIDAVPHVPDRCFVAGGMLPDTLATNIPIDIALEAGGDLDIVHPITREIETVRVPQGEYALRTTRFTSMSDADRVIIAGYFFVTNHHVTPVPGYIKQLAFRPSVKKAYYSKVQFTMVGDRSATTEEFIALSSDLLHHLFPHMLRSLPDWREFEAPDAAPAARD